MRGHQPQGNGASFYAQTRKRTRLKRHAVPLLPEVEKGRIHLKLGDAVKGFHQLLDFSGYVA